MRQTVRFAVCTVFWILGLAYIARGQVTPITPTGPGTICVGNTGTYSITPTAGIRYLWSVTPQGNITSSPTLPAITIYWGAVGTATVTISGYDSTNTLKQYGTETVTVEPLPKPKYRR